MAASLTASRLHKLHGITPTEAAVVLSSTSEPDTVVLQEYMQLHNFSGISVVAAMRLLLEKLCLAETDAYQIDRIMAAFAHRYHQDHQDLSAGVWHSLSMALVLLNGDLHTKTNRAKMKVSQFTANIRRNGIDGSTIPEHVLGEAYRDIKGAEIVQAAQDPADQLAGGGTASYTMHDDAAPEEADNAARVFASSEPIGQRTMTGVLMLMHKVGPRTDKNRKKEMERLDVALNTERSSNNSGGCGGCCRKRPMLPGKMQAHLYGPKLTFQTLQPSVGAEGDDVARGARGARRNSVSLKVHHEIWAVILVRNMLAVSAEGAAAGCFRLSHPDGREWYFQARSTPNAAEWVSALNATAARESSPPLPAAVAARIEWRCPTFPSYPPKDDSPAALIANIEKRLAVLRALLNSDLSDLSSRGGDSGSTRTVDKSAAALIALSLPSKKQEHGSSVRGLRFGASTRSQTSTNPSTPPEGYIVHELLRLSSYLTSLQHPDGEFQTNRSNQIAAEHVTPTPAPAPSRRLSLTVLLNDDDDDDDGSAINGGGGDGGTTIDRTHFDFRKKILHAVAAEDEYHSARSADVSLSKGADISMADSLVLRAHENSCSGSDLRYRTKSGSLMTRTKSTVIRLGNSQTSRSALSKSGSSSVVKGGDGGGSGNTFAISFPSPTRSTLKTTASLTVGNRTAGNSHIGDATDGTKQVGGGNIAAGTSLHHVLENAVVIAPANNSRSTSTTARHLESRGDSDGNGSGVGDSDYGVAVGLPQTSVTSWV